MKPMHKLVLLVTKLRSRQGRWSIQGAKTHANSQITSFQKKSAIHSALIRLNWKATSFHMHTFEQCRCQLWRMHLDAIPGCMLMYALPNDKTVVHQWGIMAIACKSVWRTKREQTRLKRAEGTEEERVGEIQS